MLADGTVLDYDFLVIATGAKLAWDAVPGLGPKGYSHSIFTPPDADNATGKAADGSPNKVVINYIDKYQTVNDLYWSVEKLAADTDYLLESEEKFKIIIGDDNAGEGAGNLIDALTTPLNVNTEFSLILQTPLGAVLEIERTTPAYMDKIMNLR
ncbi:MAG: hypothetical protein N2506_06480, partial [Dehalococcoidales bacterium]|nr:hypothetical protein [Dehalococcoidales bacterium]